MKLAKGFTCPNCRGRLKCVRNRPRSHGVEDRKRRCGKCGYERWTTERFKEGAYISPAQNKPPK